MNQNNTSRVIGFAIFLILFSTSFRSTWTHAQDAEKQLRWNLQTGAQLSVELKQKTGMKTKIQNRLQEIGNEMNLIMTWDIQSKEDSSYVIKQTIDRIWLSITAPSGGAVVITSIDTDSDEKTTEFGQRLLDQINPLIGTEFMVTMSDRGEITNIDIPKKSMEAIRLAPASMQLRQVLTEKGLKELIGQSAIVFPEAALMPGDDWDAVDSIENDMAKLTKKTTYTYNGAKESDGQSFDAFSAVTAIESATETENNSIRKFAGSGEIKFSQSGDGIFSSRFNNEMTTARKYRDQNINTIVRTDVWIKATKK